MSAILGVVNRGKNNIDFIEKMTLFNKYKFDRVSEYNHKQVHFACFHQTVTVESNDEVLPYFDDESNLMITADAIIDNRDDLIKELKLKVHCSDSQIILESYKKWGKKCPQYLLGDFAFAIYDFTLNEIILVRDQLGKRTLYYCLDENQFSFSTIMAPLVNKHNLLNDSYIRKFLSIRIVMDNTNNKDTVYNNVFHVLPASIMTFKDGEINETIYWSLKHKKNKMTDVERVKEFKKIFVEAVNCRLRTSGNVGIMLSGGLDSSAVGCFAAQKLALSNENLYTYTTVVSPKFKVESPKFKSVDESNYILLMSQMYPNIKPKFLELDADSSFTVIDSLLHTLEQPYKFVINSHWLNAIPEEADKDKCRVLLDGQAGNLTFSYGSIGKYFFDQLIHFKWKSFYKDFSLRCSKLGVGRKKSFLDLMKIFVNNKSKDLDVFMNPYSKLTRVELRDTINYINVLSKPFGVRKNVSKVIKKNTDPALLNHLAAFETRFGLKYNLLRRDPTRDVRVIEACYDMPISVFNRNGDNRMLAHDIMKNEVPDELLYSRVKGLQSGDFLNRLEKDWQTIITSLNEDVLTIESLSNYFDTDKFLKYLDNYKELKLEHDDNYRANVRNILIVANLIQFIKNTMS